MSVTAPAAPFVLDTSAGRLFVSALRHLCRLSQLSYFARVMLLVKA